MRRITHARAGGGRALGGATCLLWFACWAPAQTAPPSTAASPAVAKGVEQLRHAHGEWIATTEFLKPDGSVARRAAGQYLFEWVVPDRVLRGRSDIPELEMASGILFYVQERKALLEMVSVGRDGQLWVMSGPADGETRTTPPTEQADGSFIQLRFTRSNVTPDRFESKMEYSSDSGKTWTLGSRQMFERRGKRSDPGGMTTYRGPDTAVFMADRGQEPQDQRPGRRRGGAFARGH